MKTNNTFSVILSNRQNESLKRLLIPFGFAGVTNEDEAYEYSVKIFSNVWNIGTVTQMDVSIDTDRLTMNDI